MSAKQCYEDEENKDPAGKEMAFNAPLFAWTYCP